MAIQRKNRGDLRAYFQTGDRPTQSEFEELIESGVNIIDDKAIQTDIDAATPSDEKFVTVSSAQKIARKSITVNGASANLTTGNIQITNVPASSITGVIPSNSVDLSGKQDTLVSGTNIKSINATSILGTGNINLATSTDITNIQTSIATKQDTLVSLTNIRTINGNSLLGNTDLVVTGVSLNPFIANDVSIITYGTSGALVGSLFCLPVNTGTVSQVTLATTSKLASIQRVKFASAATAGAIAGTRNSTLECFRGNIALCGGFTSTVRFGLSTLQAGMRAFIGLSSASNGAPTNIDPLSNTVDHKIGMAINLNTGNWKLVHNLATAIPTIIDLGANFPVNSIHFYEFTISCLPNATAIDYKVKNLITGAEVIGTASTNLPSNSAFIGRTMWLTNNTTAAAVSIDLNKWVLEKN
jgi:hypothetical protein